MHSASPRKDSKMLSEQLDDQTIRNTYLDTKDIIRLFKEQQAHGIEAMNLKLVIDLLGTIEVDK